jgi:ADP-ribose pyrophosphatase YjhB (NUDIX family)
MFKFCPVCASEKISFADGKAFRCPDCGFVYYHNTAAATGCVIAVPEIAADGAAAYGDACGGNGAAIGAQRLLFLVRGKAPAKGKLDLPGGFVDPGEGALEGLYRELQEEIGWTPPVPKGAPLTTVFTLFASFPNVYPYKNIAYNTCDLYFSLFAPGLREKDLRLRQGEIAAARFLKPEEINYNEIAFESTRRAVKAYLTLHYQAALFSNIS